MIKKEENKFIVYVHINSFTKEPFYVGIGIKGRDKQTKKRSERWVNYVRKYGFESYIVEEKLKWAEACSREKDIIKNIGRKDFDAGPLINMTNGGDGTGGYQGYWKGKKRGETSQEIKEKLSQSSSRFWLGKHHSQETKSKIAECLKGRKKPEAARAKLMGITPWNKGKMGAPSKRRGISWGLHSEETKLKMSMVHKKRQMESPMSQETKIKIVETRRLRGNYFKSDEERKRISEGVKNYFIRKKAS